MVARLTLGLARLAATASPMWASASAGPSWPSSARRRVTHSTSSVARGRGRRLTGLSTARGGSATTSRLRGVVDVQPRRRQRRPYGDERAHRRLRRASAALRGTRDGTPDSGAGKVCSRRIDARIDSETSPISTAISVRSHFAGAIAPPRCSVVALSAAAGLLTFDLDVVRGLGDHLPSSVGRKRISVLTSITSLASALASSSLR